MERREKTKKIKVGIAKEKRIIKEKRKQV